MEPDTETQDRSHIYAVYSDARGDLHIASVTVDRVTARHVFIPRDSAGHAFGYSTRQRIDRVSWSEAEALEKHRNRCLSQRGHAQLTVNNKTRELEKIAEKKRELGLME